MTEKNFYFDSSNSASPADDNWRHVNRLNLALLDSPEQYKVFDNALIEAVNTALGLGMPLLLTGEPGVGKSTLANFLAYRLGCGRPLTYRVKSTTEGKDLFYQIDQLRRMADAYRRGDTGDQDIRPYLEFTALGKAVLRTWSRDQLEAHDLHTHAWPTAENGVNPESGWGDARSSVVLIDEIDKATTDVPNDILEEIRTLSFTIPELPKIEFELFEHTESNPTIYRPFVLITSNSERSLPDAFLRRCVYFHMTFPHKPGESPTGSVDSDDNQRRFDELTRAINARIDSLFDENPSAVYNQNRDAGWNTFWQLRRDEHQLKRKPSTGELLNWLSSVCRPSRSAIQIGGDAWNRLACQLLVKQRDDVDTAMRVLKSAKQ